MIPIVSPRLIRLETVPLVTVGTSVIRLSSYMSVVVFSFLSSVAYLEEHWGQT
jgi:hypothetical protein